MPSERFSSALTGQIVTHGAVVQWLQRRTAKCRRTAGKRPFSVYLTQVRKLPHRHVVLRLAGDRAGVAADAAAVVDQEPVLHGGTL